MKQHPLSALFPAMPQEELLALAKNIKAKGLKHAVTMYDGMVLDGWNRVQACQMAGIQVKETKYSGDDPAGFVLSENILHRHLSASQRAMIEVQLREWVPQGINASRGAAPGAAPVTTMAAEARTSERTIRQAKQVEKSGSDALKEAVKRGEISVKKAAKASTLPKTKQVKAATAAPKTKPEPAADTVTMAEYNELAEELKATKEHCQDLTDELKTAVALTGTDAAKEMNVLRSQLRQVIAARDALMGKNKALNDTVNYWKAQAKKLGWKPSGKEK